MRLKDLIRTEKAQAAAAPVKGVVAREVGQETPEVSNPGVVLIPIEQVDSPLKHLLCSIEWVAPLPLIIEEGVYVDPNPHIVFDGGDVGDLDGIVELVKSIIPEEMVIGSVSVSMLPVDEWWGA